VRIGRARVPGLLGEAADEGERGLCDLSPAVVDGQGVSSLRDLGELGHALVVLLSLILGRGDGRGDRVVLRAGDDQERSPVGVADVAPRLAFSTAGPPASTCTPGVRAASASSTTRVTSGADRLAAGASKTTVA